MALTKITTSVVAVNSLTAANIADNTIDATKIAQNQILARHIANATALTLDGGVTVDEITIDADTITATDDFIIDATTNIFLDADAGEVVLRDGGTNFGYFHQDSDNFEILSTRSDGDIIIKGNDGGSTITALTLDMSDAGTATFNHDIRLGDNGQVILGAGSDFSMYHDGSNTIMNEAGTGGLRISSSAVRMDLNSDTDYSSTGEPAGILTLYNSNGSDGGGVNNYSSLEFNTGDGATSQGFINYVRTADNQGSFAFSQRTGSSSYAESIRIDNSGHLLVGKTSGTSGNKVETDGRISAGAGSNSQPTFNCEGDTNTGINLPETDRIQLITAGTERVRIAADGNVGIGDSNPQHPFKVHLTDGEIAMFGSNGMNSPGNYAGIGLGQVLANNTTYQKVSLVTEGRNSGSYVQDFHILVDTVADPNSAVLADAKLTIDGGTGAITMPAQPCFSAALPAATSQDNVIVFGGEHLDVGGHYDISNGRFTAPIAGNYYFSFWILMDPASAGAYSRVLFRKNGSTSTQYTDNLESTDAGATADYHSVGGAAIIPLSASDYVDLYNAGQNPTYGTSYGNFSGFLVS